MTNIHIRGDARRVVDVDSGGQEEGAEPLSRQDQPVEARDQGRFDEIRETAEIAKDLCLGVEIDSEERAKIPAAPHYLAGGEFEQISCKWGSVVLAQHRDTLIVDPARVGIPR